MIIVGLLQGFELRNGSRCEANQIAGLLDVKDHLVHLYIQSSTPGCSSCSPRIRAGVVFALYLVAFGLLYTYTCSVLTTHCRLVKFLNYTYRRHGQARMSAAGRQSLLGTMIRRKLRYLRDVAEGNND